MRVRLEDGFREIEIVDRSHVVELYDQDMAVAYFRRLFRDPANRAALRRALGDALAAAGLFRMEDEEILRELARRVVHGDLRILVRNVLPSGHNATPPGGAPSTTPRQDEQSAREERPAAAAAAPESAPAVVEEETDPVVAGMDAEAQAATLQAAAASGAPFCEL